jgi:hypothetical protein
MVAVKAGKKCDARCVLKGMVGDPTYSGINRT